MAGYTPPPLPDYPATQFITLPDGRKLAYVDYPVDERKEQAVLLFFHGGPGSRMTAQIFHQTAKDFRIRILSFDRPGYGRSTPHPSPTTLVNAQDASFLLKQLNIDNVVVMGMSGGGPAAAATAAFLGPCVARGLILISAVAPAFELGGHFKAFEGAVLTKAYVAPALASIPAFLGDFLASMIPPMALNEKVLQSLPESERQAITKDNLKMINVDLQEAFVGGGNGPAVTWKTYLSEFRNLNDPSAWGFRATEIASPAVVIHGDADKSVPLKHAEYWCKSIPNAELIVSAGEGHFGAMKLGRDGDLCPDIFRIIVKWSSQEL